MIVLHLVIAAVLAAQTPPVDVPAEPVETEAELQAAARGRAYSVALGKVLSTSASPRERALGTRFYLDSPTDANTAAGARALREAAAAAPSDVLVQAMWATASEAESGCDAASPCPERLLAQARAEPGNGLAWLPAFGGLDSKASEAEIESLLAKLAFADHYNDHFADYVGAWARAIASGPTLPRFEPPSLFADHPSQAMKVSAIAYAAAMVMPGMQTLLKLCRRSEQGQAPARRFELCAEAGRGMMRSGTSYISQSMGFALVRVSGLATADDKQLKRRLSWRMQGPENVSQFLDQPREFDLYFEDLLSTGSESRAVELLMQRHGIALEPPPDWKSPYIEE
jgi:hypothetical protein